MISELFQYLTRALRTIYIMHRAFNRKAHQILCGLLAVVVLFPLAACGDNQPYGLTSDPKVASVIGTSAISVHGQFAGAGSSAQKAAVEAWTAGYNFYQSDVDIAYDPSGSGAGVNNFLQGTTIWAGSDKPLTSEQRQSSRSICFNNEQAIDVPVYISPLAVVYNLPSLGSEHIMMSSQLIAQVFNGSIKRWNDPAIKSLNSSIADKLPDIAITPIWRSDKSGTTNSFQDYLHQSAPQDWPTSPQETWAGKVGQGAKGTAGVISAISQAEGTVGYADAAQAGNFGTVAVALTDKKSQTVQGVPPDTSKAAALVDQAVSRVGAGDDIVVSLDYAHVDADEYPITQVSYTITCPSYSNQQDADFMGSWLYFQGSQQGQNLAATTAGSAPLPVALQNRITDIAGRILKSHTQGNAK